jgi:hypothetical protein
MSAAKSTKNIWVAAGIAVVVGIAGYLFFLKRQADKLLNLTYTFQRFRVTKAKLNNFEFTVEVVLTNPSSVDFTISQYDINIFFQDAAITTIKGDNLNIAVPANESVPIPLTVSFDPRKLGGNLLQIFVDLFILNSTTSNAQKSMRFQGTVSGKFGALGFKNVPIDYTYDLGNS